MDRRRCRPCRGGRRVPGGLTRPPSKPLSIVHEVSGGSGKEFRARLGAAIVWRGDRTDELRYADVTGMWRDAVLLRALGPALADLFPASPPPTVVLGPDSRGSLIGPLVAVHLGVGFVEVRKNRGPDVDSDQWVQQTTPPDYHDRHLQLGFRRGLVHSSDRVLVTDDWIETGSQAQAAKRLVEAVDATWLGIACIVDALTDARLRRDLGVRSLLHVRDLR
jgi:adenine phosphoribosyltransferase